MLVPGGMLENVVACIGIVYPQFVPQVCHVQLFSGLGPRVVPAPVLAGLLVGLRCVCAERRKSLGMYSADLMWDLEFFRKPGNSCNAGLPFTLIGHGVPQCTPPAFSVSSVPCATALWHLGARGRCTPPAFSVRRKFSLGESGRERASNTFYDGAFITLIKQ